MLFRLKVALFYSLLLIILQEFILANETVLSDLNSMHELEQLDSAEVSLFDFAEISDSVASNSNCSQYTYASDLSYIFRVPNPLYGDSAYAQRFTAIRPETLLTVEFLVYQSNNGTFGNDDIYITIYADNGSELPGAEIGRVILPAGTYPAYPALALADFTGLNLILYGDYHVAFSTSGEPGIEYEYIISSGEQQNINRSSVCGASGFPGWHLFKDVWGLDLSFSFFVTTCKDEYTQCGVQTCASAGVNNWALPSADGHTMFAQKFTGIVDTCRLDNARVRLTWPQNEPNLPLYTHGLRISVCHDSGGIPGPAICSDTLGIQDYIDAGLTQPGISKTLRVDFSPIFVLLSFDVWIIVESLAPDSISGVRLVSDGGAGDCTLGFAAFDNSWGFVAQLYNKPDAIALAAYLGYCCQQGFCCPPPPSLIEIPIHFNSIQAGIEAASDGDTVLVHPGTYLEAIYLGGKRITVASKFLTTGVPAYIDSTIILSTNYDYSVYFFGPGNDFAKLIGFTLTHNGCPNPGELAGVGIICTAGSPLIANNHIINNCGGINCFDASPIITNNLIAENIQSFGGGLYVSDGSPIVSANVFKGNRAGRGGAIYCEFSSLILVDNLITYDTASRGSAIYGQDSEIDILNCTITGNRALSSGLIGLSNSSANISRSVLALNVSNDTTWYCQGSPSTLTIHCTNIFGNSGGDWNFCGTVIDSADNFSLNPLFCNPFSGDFRLNQYSPCAAANSPCGTLIGAIDVGCTYLCGDATGDGLLNLSDLAFLHQYYFECGELPLYFSAGDANCDGKIDLGDIVYLAAHLNSTGPPPCCP